MIVDGVEQTFDVKRVQIDSPRLAHMKLDKAREAHKEESSVGKPSIIVSRLTLTKKDILKVKQASSENILVAS